MYELEFPTKEFSEINRVLFTAFDDSKNSDEAIEAHRSATREVELATKAVKKLFDILKKKEG